ncbi:SHOCT domain-containing protein [Candidatus Woesearchaeota archaeon]|nr:SHOCT domain-containing protein [Candidatus Woesearchaeota archaeon]
MKKIIPIIMIAFLLSALSYANEENLEEAKTLIGSGISCNELSDEQLEIMGDYYMEQMHPGEAHELMDNMMGGEGSESLKQVHINIAKRIYCKESFGGMMGSGGMMGMMGNNMMGGQTQQSSMMQGIMGNDQAYYGYNSFWNILWPIFLIGVIALIIWLVHKKGKESETPINILQKRYAKGEINKKQFEEMKKELRK